MLTTENLKKANEQLKKTPIKGKDYAQVNERVRVFRDICPGGSITTEILSLENGVVTMQSTVKDENGQIIATGLAYEKEGSTFINKTSFIENCETSAVGRALGFAGIGIDESMASAEELVTAIINQGNEPQKKTSKGRRSDTPEEAKLNQEMRESVDPDLVPHGEGMTDKRKERIRSEMKRTGYTEKQILGNYELESLDDMQEATYIAAMNIFAKKPTKE